RHVGETVAAVVAENRRIAEDAVDLIQVEYEVLPAVVDPLKALEPGAALLHEELGTNLTEARVMQFGDFEGAFAGATAIVESDFYWGRSAGQPMDTNGAVASLDEGSGLLTIYCNSLSFSYLQWLLGTSLKIPATKLTVVPMIAGGSFGSKGFHRKGPILAGFLGRCPRRPGEVRRGPARPRQQLRPSRVRSALPRPPGARRRRDDARPRHRCGRRLRRLQPVRYWHPRQRPRAGNRALQDVRTALLGEVGADEQEPAGRLPRLRLGGRQLRARAAGRPGCPQAEDRSGRATPQEPASAGRVPLQHPDRQLLPQCELPRRPRR